MASSAQRRKIFAFATPAGSSFGTHGGGTKLPFPNFMKHWGVMIASGENDPGALMIELDKNTFLDQFMKDLSFRCEIHPKFQTRAEREAAEWRNPKIKIKDTGLMTTCTDAQIRAAAYKACEEMGGTYHLTEFNCQTMADYLIGKIQHEKDRYFDRTQLEEAFGVAEDVIDKVRDHLPRWLGGN